MAILSEICMTNGIRSGGRKRIYPVDAPLGMMLGSKKGATDDCETEQYLHTRKAFAHTLDIFSLC